MFIFYDFETSSRELIGQILSYCFIVTDDQLNTIDECSGHIKLNRLQIPEPEAILVNKLNIDWLQEHGKPEYEAALTIFNFLQRLTSLNETCFLVGFNSNQFDLNFLRVLLIRYGFNPYFKGKLKNIDMLHLSQYIAFKYPQEFPWTLSETAPPYYSFTLETLSTQFNLLTGPQSHDAKEDVILTIALAKYYKNHFEISLEYFHPFTLEDTSTLKTQTLFKVKSRHFPKVDETLQHFIYTPYLLLASQGSTILCINIDTFHKDTPLDSIKYLNSNKHFFIAEPLSTIELEMIEDKLTLINQCEIYNSLKQNPAHYFDLIKKDWDIDYQIHELGFTRIDQLRPLAHRLIQEPSSYMPTVKQLVNYRQNEKDNYLIQLYNRIYLNYHPHPQIAHIQRYVIPRYVTGEMLRDWDNFRSIEDTLTFIEESLNKEHLETKDKENLTALKEYIQSFYTHYITTEKDIVDHYSK